MDSLLEDLKNLTLHEQQKSRTGFIYHEELNLHHPGPKDQCPGNIDVFENPDRIKNPLNKLKESKPFLNC